MRTVVAGKLPPEIEEWLDLRRERGQDLFDEIWEGDYHAAPAPHPRHGELDDQVAGILRPRAIAAGLIPVGPLNIGREDDYRVPDRAYLRERSRTAFVPTAAVVVEIVSPGDETFEKLDFYFERGVSELLIVDSPRGSVAWYRRGERGFERSGESQLLGLSADDLSAQIDWPPED